MLQYHGAGTHFLHRRWKMVVGRVNVLSLSQFKLNVRYWSSWTDVMWKVTRNTMFGGERMNLFTFYWNIWRICFIMAWMFEDHYIFICAINLNLQYSENICKLSTSLILIFLNKIIFYDVPQVRRHVPSIELSQYYQR